MTTTHTSITRINALVELDAMGRSVDRMNATTARVKLQQLGVTHVKGKALDDPLKKILKADLIAAIKREMKLPRVDAPSTTMVEIALPSEDALLLEAEGVQDWSDDGLAERYLSKLRRLTDAQRHPTEANIWLAPDPQINAEAAQLAIFIGGLKSNGQLLAPSSRLNAATHIRKLLNRLVDAEIAQPFHDDGYRHHLRRNADQFITVFMRGLGGIREQKVANENVKLDSRSSTVLTINPTKLIALAYGVLSELGEDTPASAWKDVSCALAIATGRRQSELHCTGNFELLGEYALHFTGQAKTKTDKGFKSGGEAKTLEGYLIPTLIPAELCVKGLQWLADNGKRCDTTVKVNKNLSPYLSDTAYAIFCASFGSEMVDAEKERTRLAKEEGRKDEAENRFTYHGFRAIYAKCCVETFKPDTETDAYYVGSILGHGDSETKGGRAIMRDVSGRYLMNFNFAEGSLCHWGEILKA